RAAESTRSRAPAPPCPREAGAQGRPPQGPLTRLGEEYVERRASRGSSLSSRRSPFDVIAQRALVGFLNPPRTIHRGRDRRSGRVVNGRWESRRRIAPSAHLSRSRGGPYRRECAPKRDRRKARGSRAIVATIQEPHEGSR